MLPKSLNELLPQGREIEGMFVANNPLRLEDTGLNFQVNLSTGSWMDIKAGVQEFGFVPLTAYVRAARTLKMQPHGLKPFAVVPRDGKSNRVGRAA